MVNIVGNHIMRGGQKIGWFSNNDIYDHEGKKIGYHLDNHIFDVDGNKIGYIMGDILRTPTDSKGIRVEDTLKDVLGAGNIDDMMRCAIHLLF